MPGNQSPDGAEGSAPHTSLRTVRGVCPHDCPDTCAMRVTVAETPEGPRAIKVEGDPDHPTTAGFLCAKVSRYLERTYHPERVLYPQKRVGAKGEGRFERISWDEALETIAQRFRSIVHEHGPQAILPYSYAGTMGLLNGQSMDRRFFHKLGASLLDRTICSTAGSVGYRYSMGLTVGTDPESFVDSKLILLWGTNTLTSNPHLWPFIKTARKRGAKVIAIDPWKSRTAAQCDEHLAILPGTDAALALGMMHILFRDGLHDQDYLDQYCVGGEQLKARALEYPPDKVAQLCGIPVERLEALAHAYATVSPAVIRLNYGLQRHYGGGMAVRTVSCLPAVTGSWRHHAGGVVLSTSGTYPFHYAALEHAHFIPKGTRTINMSCLGEALQPDLPQPVKALFVYNSNPGAVAPDLEQVLSGLAREDLFTVVSEHFVTDTARYADLLLPATTQLEHGDLHRAYGHLYVMWNEPSIPPVGESIPNTELFRRLARRMGFTEPCFQDSDEDMARQALTTDHPNFKGITFDNLKARGWQRLSIPRPFAPFAQGNFFTPSGKCELYSQKMKDEGFDPLPTYTPPREDVGSALAERFPLMLLSPPAHHFLNSTFANVLVRYEAGPTLEIHPLDAAVRGIQPQQRVLIHNDRGGFEAHAEVTERVRPGVVVAPSIWWLKLGLDGRNANHTTSQALTDMGGGATFYDNRVDVTPVD